MDSIFSDIYTLRKQRKYKQAIKHLKKFLKKDNLNKDTIYWCYERLSFFYRKTNQEQKEIELLEYFLEHYHGESLYHHLLQNRYDYLTEE